MLLLHFCSSGKLACGIAHSYALQLSCSVLISINQVTLYTLDPPWQVLARISFRLSYTVSCAVVWNYLPTDLRVLTGTTTTFYKHLKTCFLTRLSASELFILHYINARITTTTTTTTTTRVFTAASDRCCCCCCCSCSSLLVKVVVADVGRAFYDRMCLANTCVIVPWHTLSMNGVWLSAF